MTSRAADAACVTRARVLEVHRVASKQVALQEEAKNVRERRLALEEVMRQERSRRLQAAASRRTEAPNRGHASGPATPSREQEEGSALDSSAAPQTLEEYRRELDNVNGNKDVFRLHYYTNGHLNPADVHFYTVNSRVKEYQRHAPSPPRSAKARGSTSPACKAHAKRELTPSSTLALLSAPVMEGTSEQWTKSALLRMQANQHMLQRIEEREKEEAAHMGRPIVRDTAAPASHRNAPPQPYKAPFAASAIEHHPSRATEATVSECDVPLGLELNQSYAASAPTQRRSSPLQLSPPKTYTRTSSLLFRDHTAPPSSAWHNSSFKPSLIYGSSAALHAPRTETLLRASAGHSWVSESPRKPLEHSWMARSAASGSGSAFRSIVERPPNSAWEEHCARTELTQLLSPTRQGATDLFSLPRGSSPRGAGGVASCMPSANPPTSTPKPTLLDGFRMPHTVLKREDLFQGFC
ncbi:hypothetical protein LSCM4_01147 [Leishmania orientalis]|uniref:Uncharacterized protein n=1 Tax=Leishmania orientalis TaxID=2249476 RepID=A0A836G7S1_9TRYP|nr:hypothetical protein LSCM4_01147 [Leishmania orientalis]